MYVLMYVGMQGGVRVFARAASRGFANSSGAAGRAVFPSSVGRGLIAAGVCTLYVCRIVAARELGIFRFAGRIGLFIWYFSNKDSKRESFCLLLSGRNCRKVGK